ncbi:hypothetical protein EOD41_19305 [Mucilaginibacter limnophilus]|uniref:Uncharacterized protein n=2 Tax=Mucilaginibacter limnophilus TaxID=1932778 RepID=A0A437MI51_9SPHI|nr:hypothetical protein EOD41_19305 [Mucilaginibacter limnophilus]
MGALWKNTGDRLQQLLEVKQVLFLRQAPEADRRRLEAYITLLKGRKKYEALIIKYQHWSDDQLIKRRNQLVFDVQLRLDVYLLKWN